MLFDKKWDQQAEPPKPLLEEWRQHLLESAQYIKDHGWCQRDIQDDQGRVCVLGALSATRRGDIYPRSTLQVKKFLGLHPTASIVIWNNAPERSKEEVIAALEGAAKAP